MPRSICLQGGVVALLEGKAAQFALPAPKTMDSLDSQPSFSENHLPMPPKTYSAASTPRPAQAPLQLPQRKPSPTEDESLELRSSGERQVAPDKEAQQLSDVVTDAKPTWHSRDPLFQKQPEVEQPQIYPMAQQQAQSSSPEGRMAESLRPPLETAATATHERLESQNPELAARPHLDAPQPAQSARATSEQQAAVEQDPPSAVQPDVLSERPGEGANLRSYREATAAAQPSTAGKLQEPESLGRAREIEQDSQPAEQSREKPLLMMSDPMGAQPSSASRVDARLQSAEPPFREEPPPASHDPTPPTTAVENNQTAEAGVKLEVPDTSHTAENAQPQQIAQYSGPLSVPEDLSRKDRPATDSSQKLPEAEQPAEDPLKPTSEAQPLKSEPQEEAAIRSGPPASVSSTTKPLQQETQPFAEQAAQLQGTESEDTFREQAALNRGSAGITGASLSVTNPSAGGGDSKPPHESSC